MIKEHNELLLYTIIYYMSSHNIISKYKQPQQFSSHEIRGNSVPLSLNRHKIKINLNRLPNDFFPTSKTARKLKPLRFQDDRNMMQFVENVEIAEKNQFFLADKTALFGINDIDRSKIMYKPIGKRKFQTRNDLKRQLVQPDIRNFTPSTQRRNDDQFYIQLSEDISLAQKSIKRRQNKQPAKNLNFEQQNMNNLMNITFSNNLKNVSFPPLPKKGRNL